MKAQRLVSTLAQPPRADHINAVRQVVEAMRQTPFCERRYKRNVKNPPSIFSKEDFWRQMIVCICTSVQKSGPESRVSKMVREDPFPLRLESCVQQKDLRQFAEAILRSRGLRFGSKLAAQIEANMVWLNEGGWEKVEREFVAMATSTASNTTPQQRIAVERDAARIVMGRNGGLAGFGPKQARNLWQCLGVTQYEIPLDSRVAGWMKALSGGFEIDLSRLYASVGYYEKKMSEIQALCAEARVLPCEFDAAVFAQADKEEWPIDDIVF